ILAQGDFTTSPFTADVKGTVLIGAGLLGSLLAEVTVDSTIDQIVVDLQGKIYYGFLDGHVRVVSTATQLGFLPSVAMEVPSFVPIVVGLKLAEADALGIFPKGSIAFASIDDGVVTLSNPLGLASGGTIKFTTFSKIVSSPPEGFDTNKVYYVTPTSP